MSARKSKLDLADRIQLTISYILRATLIIGIISGALKENWLSLFLAASALLLTFLPSLIERNYKIYLPIEFEFIVVAFVYASLFLGEVHSYYNLFWWWDVVLHSTAGITFGFLGFLIMYVLYREGKIQTSPVLIALFSFSFAVAIGAVWEIFEFAMDSMFRLNMQRSGLVDTMWDMIVNASGAFLTSIIGYFYVKGGDSLLFNRLVNKFIKENPKMFAQKQWQRYS